MASIEKVSKAIPQLLNHNNRFEGDGIVRKNKDIDSSRTHLNYQLKKGSVEELNSKLKDIYHIKRANLVKLHEIVVTLPKDVKPEDEKKFFEAIYDYFCEDYGKENIINASVHKDEFQPHIHIEAIPTLPIDFDKLNDREKANRVKRWKESHPEATQMLCSKERLNRYYLQHLHPNMLKFVTERLGYECEILNGATKNGNRTVLEMKNDKLSQEVALLENKKNSLKTIIKDIEETLESGGYNFDKNYVNTYNLLKDLELSKAEIKVLRECIQANGLKLPSMDEISKNRIDFMLEGQKTVYMENTILDSECDTLVVDMNDSFIIDRLPSTVLSYIQEKHIKNNDGLYRVDDNEKTYYLFCSSNNESILHNLLLLKEEAKECGALSFPLLKNDEYKLAERILPTCNFNTEFRIGDDSFEKQLLEETKEWAEEIHSVFAEALQESGLEEFEEYGDGEISSPSKKLNELFEKDKPLDLGR